MTGYGFEFQSLLSWISSSAESRQAGIRIPRVELSFQSLLSWISSSAYSQATAERHHEEVVSILVVMDQLFSPLKNITLSSRETAGRRQVSILVVMDQLFSLAAAPVRRPTGFLVSILVVMDQLFSPGRKIEGLPLNRVVVSILVVMDQLFSRRQPRGGDAP